MKRLQLVCLLGFLTVACRDVADPTLRRPPLSAVIDAAAGALEVTLTYNGGPPSASGAVGQLVARIIAPAQSLGPVTDHATFTDIGPGSYTLFISGVLLQSETAVQVGGGGVFVNDPLQDAVTIAAGRKTTHSFELAPAVGIVKGTATINGQHPAAGSKICVNTVERSNGGDLLRDHSCAELAPPPEVCTITSEGPPPGCGPAPFALFAAPADGLSGLGNTVSIVSAAGHTLGSTAVRIVAGQTTDIGTFDVGTGALAIALTYNGATPSASGAVGDFAASLFPDPTCRAVAPQQSKDLGLITAHAPFTDIIPCTYTLAITGPLLPLAVSRTTGLPSPDYPLITITAGTTTTQSFDVTPVVGIVKGTATINGQHPAAGSEVCVNTAEVSSGA